MYLVCYPTRNLIFPVSWHTFSGNFFCVTDACCGVTDAWPRPCSVTDEWPDCSYNYASAHVVPLSEALGHLMQPT